MSGENARRVAVVGGGAWGTALANAAAAAGPTGHPVAARRRGPPRALEAPARTPATCPASRSHPRIRATAEAATLAGAGPC